MGILKSNYVIASLISIGFLFGVVACTDAEPGTNASERGMNDAELHIESVFSEVSTVCDESVPETIRFAFDPTPDIDFNDEPRPFLSFMVGLHLWEIDQLSVSVEEIELTGADQQNGITFKGRVLFDESMSYRDAWKEFDGEWTNWTNWQTIPNGNAEIDQIHTIKKQDNQWIFESKGAVSGGVFPPIRVMKYLFGETDPLELAIGSCFLGPDQPISLTDVSRIDAIDALTDDCVNQGMNSQETCACSAEKYVDVLDIKWLKAMIEGSNASDGGDYLMNLVNRASPSERGSFMASVMEIAEDCGQ